jgi:hypothetical protein
VVWDTRTNRPANAAIHRQFGCPPHPDLPTGVAVNTVTPDMGVFTLEDRHLTELFRFALRNYTGRDRFAGSQLA